MHVVSVFGKNFISESWMAGMSMLRALPSIRNVPKIHFGHYRNQWQWAFPSFLYAHLSHFLHKQQHHATCGPSPLHWWHLLGQSNCCFQWCSANLWCGSEQVVAAWNSLGSGLCTSWRITAGVYLHQSQVHGWQCGDQAVGGNTLCVGGSLITLFWLVAHRILVQQQLASRSHICFITVYYWDS